MLYICLLIIERLKMNNIFPLHDQIVGFSRGLFSTWIYHRRFNTLFDCGEGVSTTLCNRVFGIKRILLSHGHADHIAGLVNLLNIRNLGAGDQHAELKIYYPQENVLLEYMREYLKKTQRDLSFPLKWIAIKPQQLIELEEQKGRVYIKTFKTLHSQKQLSVGYNVIEVRRKLKEKYINASQQELNEKIIKHGRDEVSYDYEKIVFTYGGDSRPIDPLLIEESLYLCHECTYLDSIDDERNYRQHSCLEDVIVTADKAKVKNLLLFHTSLRYSLDELRIAAQKVLLRLGSKCKVFILFGDSLINVNENQILKGFRKAAKLKDLKVTG